MTIISPSILSSDFCNLENEIKRLEPYCPWLHIDVMDGHFVPNITIGIPVVKSIRKVTNMFLDTHLMIENPIKYVDDFCEAGSDLITFHYEAALDNTLDTIKAIKKNKKRAGISIKPKTPSYKIFDYLKYVDLVLIMTVEPGFSGQKFISSAAEKIVEIKKVNKKVVIQVDGGINNKTASLCRALGAKSLVSGNYIFKAPNYQAAIASLKE